MKIRVLAFAALRESLGAGDQILEITEGFRVADAWALLAAAHPSIEAQRASMRVARNARIVGFDELLRDGDEVALLPPVGGG